MLSEHVRGDITHGNAWRNKSTYSAALNNTQGGAARRGLLRKCGKFDRTLLAQQDCKEYYVSLQVGSWGADI